MSAQEAEIDALYREHPEGFVAARDRLAKDLRAAGERDEADRVKKLRRPTAAAWLVNRTALESPERLREFADAGRLLEDAQGRALEGDEDATAEWRDAVSRMQKANRAVVDEAERLARAAGHPASAKALELVDGTLRAALADPELRESVVRGRLQRERSAATLGTPAGPPPKGRAKTRKKRETAQARRELERMERELTDVGERQARLQAQVDQTEEALRQQRSKLAESKRQAAELKRRVNSAKRRASR